MTFTDRADPATLFGLEVIDEAGHRLGRVTALVHRVDGCDVLVERRRWLRHVVVRLDLEDLVLSGNRMYAEVAAERRAAGPGDDRVA